MYYEYPDGQRIHFPQTQQRSALIAGGNSSWSLTGSAAGTVLVFYLLSTIHQAAYQTLKFRIQNPKLLPLVVPATRSSYFSGMKKPELFCRVRANGPTGTATEKIPT